MVTPILFLSGKESASSSSPTVDKRLWIENDDLSSYILLLDNARNAYKESGSYNNRLVSELSLLIEDLKDIRITMNNSSDQKKQFLTLQYGDIVTKLDKLLGEEYLLDMARAPGEWIDPDGKIRAIEEHIVSFRKQIEKNKTQLLEERELDFHLVEAPLKKKFSE